MTVSYLIDFDQAIFYLHDQPLGRVDLNRAQFIGLPKTERIYHGITVSRT